MEDKSIWNTISDKSRGFIMNGPDILWKVEILLLTVHICYERSRFYHERSRYIMKGSNFIMKDRDILQQVEILLWTVKIFIKQVEILL